MNDIEGSMMSEAYSDNVFKTIFSFIPGAIILSLLFIVSRYNYLVFHTLAEFFSIIVAWGLFIIVWNTRETVKNDALVFLGIAYLFIGGLDLFHTLSYKGMGVFDPERGANPATQLWIVARYTESITLCILPFLLGKRVNVSIPIGVYSIVSGIALFLIFIWELFPDCYIDGVGLTIFKKSSEYIICILLIAAFFFLYKKKNLLDKTVYKYLAISIVLTILAELAFTFYVSVYGLSNLIGHFFKIISFYLIYKALIYTGLKRPFGLMSKEISDKEKRYQQIFETNRAIKLIINPANGSIIEANNAACYFYGYTKNEFLSLKISDINILPSNNVIEEMDSAKSENELVFNFTHRLASGDIRDVEVYSGPIKYGEDTFLHSIIHDVTERKRAEEEVEKIRAQLIQAQKMESIGTLAGGIAHDFNNILSSIIGFTELAIDDVDKGSQIEENLQEVYASGIRAKNLVSQILILSRHDTIQLKPIPINSVVREAAKMLRSVIPTSIDLQENLCNTQLVVEADPTQIHQVIVNLATNAKHAMSETGGVLAIEVEPVSFDETTENINLTPGNYARITVSDTGTGINMEYLEKIFEPYFTTKAIGEGSGLGLSVVLGIVKSHKGDIAVSSKPKKGSTFHVYLPLSEQRSVELAETDTNPLPTGTEHILMLDDEPSIIKMQQQSLEKLGYTVTAKTSSVEALETFCATPDKFDIVITDMTMPKMTGDKFAEEIKKIRSDLPVILCTGFSDKIKIRTGSDLQIDEFLIKPIDKNKLAKTVRKVLDEAKGETQQ